MWKLHVLLTAAVVSLVPAVTEGQLAWTCVTASAPWPARYSYPAVVFDNKMWVLGGREWRNDVWCSTDGDSWVLVTSSAPWSPRGAHAAVVFDNRMWVLGGDDGNPMSDVWASSDGLSWDLVRGHAGWAARLCHSALAFDNKLWVMGGNDGNNLRNDVWYSTDGDSWVCATTSAPWTPRNTCVVALAGRMWILGGYDWSNRNDIWSSTDGVQWDLVTDSAGWRPRGSHASAVWAGSIWVLGGYADGPLGDVWHSYDGANWDVANDSAPWEPRMAHASLALEDRLWVLGGTGFFPDRSDVWCTDPLALEEPLTQARPVAGVCLDAFPNPFSAGVTIRLSGRAFARALVSINNAAGVEVRRLTGGAATPAGCRLRWDGRDDAGRTTPAGVYMLRLQAGGAEFSRKLVKLR